MSVCLCRLFCIVFMMLETLTELKHLLISSSFIGPPANPLLLFCLTHSASDSFPVCLSLSSFLRCLHIFSLIPVVVLSYARSPPLSLSVCLFSLSILPLIYRSHYIHIYSIFRTNTANSPFFSLFNALLLSVVAAALYLSRLIT